MSMQPCPHPEHCHTCENLGDERVDARRRTLDDVRAKAWKVGADGPPTADDPYECGYNDGRDAAAYDLHEILDTLRVAGEDADAFDSQGNRLYCGHCGWHKDTLGDRLDELARTGLALLEGAVSDAEKKLRDDEREKTLDQVRTWYRGLPPGGLDGDDWLPLRRLLGL